MKAELQNKVAIAGLKILEVRITHLSYSPEIASAMLQRQQAAAIIDARQKIVEGAVGMVEMALAKLNENDITAGRRTQGCHGQQPSCSSVWKQGCPAHCQQRKPLLISTKSLQRRFKRWKNAN